MDGRREEVGRWWGGGGKEVGRRWGGGRIWEEEKEDKKNDIINNKICFSV
jgi:hypothetical protein